MKALFLKLWQWITGTSVKLYEFLEPILKDESAKLLEALLPIALGVVASLATSPKSGSEKLNEATEQVKSLAIGAGLTVTTTLVQTAIQLALSNLKSKGAIK